jgi:hypothetical protein
MRPLIVTGHFSSSIHPRPSRTIISVYTRWTTVVEPQASTVILPSPATELLASSSQAIHWNATVGVFTKWTTIRESRLPDSTLPATEPSTPGTQASHWTATFSISTKWTTVQQPYQPTPTTPGPPTQPMLSTGPVLSNQVIGLVVLASFAGLVLAFSCLYFLTQHARRQREALPRNTLVNDAQPALPRSSPRHSDAPAEGANTSSFAQFWSLDRYSGPHADSQFDDVEIEITVSESTESVSQAPQRYTWFSGSESQYSPLPEGEQRDVSLPDIEQSLEPSPQYTWFSESESQYSPLSEGEQRDVSLPDIEQSLEPSPRYPWFPESEPQYAPPEGEQRDVSLADIEHSPGYQLDLPDISRDWDEDRADWFHLMHASL